MSEDQVLLRFGAMSAVLEAGGLRWLRRADAEILRGVYVAVRDEAWGTVPGVIDDLDVDQCQDSFEVRFRCGHHRGDVNFDWRGRITGSADGRLRFAMAGWTGSAFRKNRIGLCILHPPESAGAPARVRTVQGTVLDGAFPTAISPDAPFTDIRSISWAVAGSGEATLEFAGDAFEMEDQRNWTDASFKTFCTPLRYPHPVRIEANTRVRQAMVLTLSTPVPPQGSGTARPTSDEVHVSRQLVARLPELGTCLAPGREQLDDGQADQLRRLGLSFARVVVEIDRPGWQSTTRAALATAQRVGVGLEIELIAGPDPAGLDELCALLASDRTDLRGCFTFPASGYATTPEVAAALRVAASRAGLTLPIGGGSRANFAELNRASLPWELLDIVGFPVSPQVHVFDDESVMENVQAQAAVVVDARRLAEGREVTVGPVTLRPRFNPYGPTRPELGPAEDDRRRDRRQATAFAAAWTIASLQTLALAGAHRVILHEATGPAGILPGVATSQALPGCDVYRLLSQITGLAVTGVRGSKSPPGVAALALEHPHGVRLLLANRTRRDQRLRLRFDDAEIASDAARLVIEPFSWASLDAAARA